MKKTIRKIGNSVGVIFNKEEQRIHNMKINEVIEFEIKKKVKDETKKQ